MSAQVSSKPNLSQAEIDAAVAVVGLGAHFPGRPGLAGYWSVIKNGIDTMTDIPPDHFLSGDYYDPDPKARDRIYVRKGAFLSPVPFEPLKYGISPKEMESTDTTQLLGLLVADQALNDAGYPADKAGHSRTAVILGVTGALKMVVSLGSRLAHPQLRRALEAEGVAPDVALSVLERFADSFQPWTESSFPGLLGNVTAGRIASRLNLHGENLAVDAACASSLAAVSQAILALRSKRCDMVVSGGVDTFNDPFMFSCFSKTPALSRTGEARAFDQAGDGTMLGEGIGVVLLKRLSDALRDGDKVYAVVRSVGGASDGRGTAIFAPSAKGQGRALEAAYAEAGFDPSTVELVEAHGTGTVVGDQVELSALSEFFTQHSGHADDASGDKPSGTLSAGRLPWCALGSVKSQIGHTKAAAGVAGLIKAILSLYYKVLPPSIHLKEPLEPLKSPGCPFYVSGEARPWISSPRHPRRAGVSAFGFGGSNFHCLLEEAGEVKTPFETGVHLAPFSANSLSRLVKAVRDLTEEARLSLSQEEAGDPRFRQDYFSQALDARLRPLLQGYDGNASEKVFVAFEAKSARDFMETLPEILLAHSNGTGIYGLPDGLFFGKAKNDGRKLVFHDPGDLPLRTGQGQGLALDFAHYHMILDHFAQGWVGSPLGLLLYPPKLLPEGAQDFLLRELRDPSSGYFLGPALSLALYELYSFFGIRSDLVAGSGPGLVSALLISGWLPIQEAVRSLGKLPAGKDPSLLRDALNGLSLFAPDRDAAPKDKAKPVLVTENGDPVQDVEEARKLLLEGLDRDIAALSDAGTPAAPSTKPPFPGMLVISAGELPFPKGEGDIPTAELARFVQNPRDTLGLARNLARLASLGVGVEFRKWSYNSYPSPRPQGHSVPLGGANLFEANGNKKGANGDAAPAKPGATSAAQAQALGDAARLRDLEGRIDKLSLAQEKTLALLEGMRESIAGLSVPVLQSVPVAPVVQSGQSGQSGQPNQITATETSQSPAAKRTGPGNGGEAYRPTELPVSPNPRLRSLAEGSPGRGNGEGETKARETKARDNKAQPNAQTGSLRAKDVRLDYVWEILSDLVARETGYPQESLDPSLDLEGDLGLDSIKRVELLSEIANAFPGAEGHLVANTLGELMDICERSLAFAEGPSEDLDEEYLSLSPQSPAGNPSQGLAEDTPIGNGGSLLAGNAAGAAYDPATTKDPLAAYTSLSVDSPPKRTFLRSQGSKALPQRGEIQDNPNYIPQDITDDDITDDDMTYDDIPADDITYDDITDDDITHDDITDDDIPAAVLSLISRETGYPVSSLGKGLSLEGDLGLDSIKKVEILSLLSDILRECDPASLTQAETIGDILNLAIASDFGQEPYYEDASQEWPQTTQGAGTSYPEPSPWQAGQGQSQGQSQWQDQSQGQWQSQGQGQSQSQGQSREQSQAAENLVLGIVARETGFPIESLKRELALESDLGLDSIKKVELLSALTEEALAKGLLAELGPISQGRLAQAQSLGEWVDFFANPTATGPGQAPVQQGQAPVQATVQATGQGTDKTIGQTTFSGTASPASPASTVSPASTDSTAPTGSTHDAPKAAAQPKKTGPEPTAGKKGHKPQASKPSAGSSQDSSQELATGSSSVARPVTRGGLDLIAAPRTSLQKPTVFKVEPVPVALSPHQDLGDFSPALVVGSNAQAGFLADSLESLGAKVSRLSWQHDFASLGKDHGYRSLIFVWPGPDRDPGLISQAMLALRQLGPKLKGMVGVTSLGGSFSYPRGDGAAPSGNPASAALSGLVKTAAREWPEVRARVIDLPLAAHEAHIPGIQERVGELLFAKGPVEVGLTGGDRTVRPALVPFRLPSGHPGAPPLSPGDTLVATGGGRGVTSVILLELARLYRPKVVILGRTPLGPPEPAWLKGLNTEKGIVRAIHKATSGVLKPLELKARAALTMRARELRNTLSALDDLGCEAEYLGGDFLDPVFLEETLRAVRTKHGPIKGLLHGAGVISDKPILEKDPGDFRRVFDTKVGLASRLLEAFQDEPLGLIVFMSSTTARLGRDGQGDYAAANEVLNKMAWDEAENRPDAKVLSIMWGPWDGGMVDEGLAKKFLSEGIGLIAPDSGAKAFASLMGLPKGHPAELLLLGYGTDLGRVLAADLAKGANPAQGYPALRAKSQGSRG